LKPTAALCARACVLLNINKDLSIRKLFLSSFIHLRAQREGGLAGAPVPAKKCPSLVNI